jgi:hypothetical protein
MMASQSGFFKKTKFVDRSNACPRTVLLTFSSCTATCTIDFCKPHWLHTFMKADLRISVKDYHGIVDSRELRVESCRVRIPPAVPVAAIPGVDEWAAVAEEWPIGEPDSGPDFVEEVIGDSELSTLSSQLLSELSLNSVSSTSRLRGHEIGLVPPNGGHGVRCERLGSALAEASKRAGAGCSRGICAPDRLGGGEWL